MKWSRNTQKNNNIYYYRRAYVGVCVYICIYARVYYKTAFRLNVFLIYLL